MAVKIGERCTTVSGRVTGTLLTYGRTFVVIRRDDGTISTAPTKSIRKIPSRQSAATKGANDGE